MKQMNKTNLSTRIIKALALVGMLGFIGAAKVEMKPAANPKPVVKVARVELLQSIPAAAPVAASVTKVAAPRIIKMEVTAYCPCKKCCGPNAQGLTASAYPQRVVIVRESLTAPKVAIVNFSDVVSGKASDIVLEPQDIVWVPTSPFDRIDKYLGEVISSFVRTVAANEGARAAVPGTPPVQPTVGIGN